MFAFPGGEHDVTGFDVGERDRGQVGPPDVVLPWPAWLAGRGHDLQDTGTGTVSRSSRGNAPRGLGSDP